MPSTPPASVVSFVQSIRSGLGGLQRKLVPAHIAILDFCEGMWAFQIVYALVELDIPDALAAGPRSSDDVAAEKEVDADALYRLLRAATNVDVVRELEGRRFELTPMGEALRSDRPFSPAEFIRFQGRIGWGHWQGLTDCVREGKTAIEIQRGVAPFEYLSESPEAADVFNDAMTSISELAVDSAAAAYDFRNKHIVDVGGGHGRLLGGILSANPTSTGVLFDLPQVVEGAGQVLGQLGVEARCETVGGSFFDESSIPEDGDIYLMRSIIHDWSDEDAIRILGNVRAAMTPRSRLLLCETVVPGPNKRHFSKFLDIEMLVHAGGRERTKDEYRALLARADLEMTGVIPTASVSSLVEARRKG